MDIEISRQSAKSGDLAFQGDFHAKAQTGGFSLLEVVMRLRDWRVAPAFNAIAGLYDDLPRAE